MAVHPIAFIVIIGLIPGLISLLFPKLIHKFVRYPAESPLTKKEEWRYRIGGIILILVSIVLLIYQIV